MKRFIVSLSLALTGVVILVLAMSGAALAGRNGTSPGNANTTTGPRAENRSGQYAAPGQKRGDNCTCAGPAQGTILDELNEQEDYWLTYMVEEEKLARDVYQVFYASYDLPIFRNIATSEQRHMDAIKKLLERYGVTDPSEGKAAGEFANPDLQALYDDMIDRGATSLAEALRVGVEIETHDITDLQEAMEATDNDDVVKVYSHLLKGSENHLKAFKKLLSR